jgi:hypothetical protein
MDGVQLTDEHILALAIAGDLIVLPNGSCLQCAAITAKTEGRCFRDLLGNFRIAVDAPTRRRREREKEKAKGVNVLAGKLDQNTRQIADVQKITVGRSDYPVMYPSYVFPPAGLSVGRDKDAEIKYEIKIHGDEKQLLDFALKHGGAWQPAELHHPIEFVRMLAKVAHSYCAAELGVDGFKPYLTDLILGRYELLTHGLQWVGCEPDVPPPTAALIDLAWNKFVFADGRKLLCAKLRLFPFFTTPVYHIIVGEWENA